MDKLNEIDLMMIEEVTCVALRDMEIKQEKGERIDKQKEFDLRVLRRKRIYVLCKYYNRMAATSGTV